jgi:hypothetical protein
MHVMIFAAFMVLALRTIMLFVMGFSESALAVLSTPTNAFWAAHGGVRDIYDAYLFVKDLIALGALVGVLYFWWLRWRVRPDRLTTHWEAYLILGFIGGLMVTEFFFGASHLVAQNSGFAKYEPVTSALALLLSGLDPRLVHLLRSSSIGCGTTKHGSSPARMKSRKRWSCLHSSAGS